MYGPGILPCSRESPGSKLSNNGPAGRMVQDAVCDVPSDVVDGLDGPSIDLLMPVCADEQAISLDPRASVRFLVHRVITELLLQRVHATKTKAPMDARGNSAARLVCFSARHLANKAKAVCKPPYMPARTMATWTTVCSRAPSVITIQGRRTKTVAGYVTSITTHDKYVIVSVQDL